MTALQPRQFPSPEELVDRVEKIKRKSQVRAQPYLGNVQPYLPFEEGTDSDGS